MGERLIINVYQTEYDEDPLYNIYYHWSGYTESALEELLYLVQHGYKTFPEAVKTIINHGGAVAYEDASLYKQQYDNSYEEPKNASRNNGLISFSTEGMKTANYYGEHFINVYLATNTFDIEEIFDHISEDSLHNSNINEDKILTNIKFENTLSIDNIKKLQTQVEYVKNNNTAINYDDEYYLLVGF